MVKVSKKVEMSLAYHTINNAQEIIVWLNDEASVLFVNEQFSALMGISKEDARQLIAADIFVGFKMNSFKRELDKLRKSKKVTKEILLRNPRGKTIPVEMNVTLFKTNDIEVYCCIMRDIRKRKRLEAQKELRLDEIENLKNKLENENFVLKEDLKLNYHNEHIVTQSEKYKRVLFTAEQVAPTDATVLITGETGTGKELVAHMIHSLSGRSEKPYIKVNCAALPPTLIESELFGHEMGAFTGAVQQKKGRFELADQSTLFLDEIGDLPLELQPKLLRVLQNGEFNRLGGTKTLKVDVRVIAATNRNLEKLVDENKYREDLYYRLNVFPIHNIPLRERKEDIPLLIRHFVDKFSIGAGKKISSIPNTALQKLKRYEFPGNIRELENIVERAVILTNGDKLQLEASFNPIRSNSKTSAHFQTLEELQRNHVIKALKRCKWKVSGKNGAAQLLNINPKTLWSRMDKLGISARP